MIFPFILQNNNIMSIKRYVFDLDKMPSKRWEHIINENKHLAVELRDFINNMIKKLGITGHIYAIVKFIINMNRTKILHAEEIQNISEMLDVDFEKILLLQLMYEMCSACTTIITYLQGERIFFRTMDWDMEILKKITIELEFIKNKKTIFIAPTWIGCVGVFTAHNVNDNYSLAVNYRNTKSISITSVMNNLWKIISMRWPISYLIRHICENDNTHKNVIGILSDQQLVSPCYITFYAHDEKDKCYVITRDCDKIVEIREGEYLIQTNKDFGEKKPNILFSNEREQIIKDALQKNKNDFKSKEEFCSAVCKFPVINDETIYICVMRKDNIYTEITEKKVEYK